MYVCNYCKRNFKNKFEICPNCSGKSFSEKANFGEMVIKTPPEGGYTVSNKTFKTRIKHIKKVTWIWIAILIVYCILASPFLFFGLALGFTSVQEHKFLFDPSLYIIIIPDIIIPMIIILVIIIYNVSSRKKIKKDKEKIKYLAKNGILVKGLPFEFVSDGSQINGKPWHLLIKVTYENANGVKIPLVSDQKYSTCDVSNKDTVDLLIDPNNYSKFYIDYEIY